MWEILLPTPEDCIALTKRDLQNKKNIIRVQYWEQHRMKVPWNTPTKCSFVLGQQVGTFLMLYEELGEIHLDKRLGDWKYHLMLSRRHFNKIPNWITINERKVAVIISRRNCLVGTVKKLVTFLQCVWKNPWGWAISHQEKAHYKQHWPKYRRRMENDWKKG